MALETSEKSVSFRYYSYFNLPDLSSIPQNPIGKINDRVIMPLKKTLLPSSAEARFEPAKIRSQGKSANHYISNVSGTTPTH